MVKRYGLSVMSEYPCWELKTFVLPPLVSLDRFSIRHSMEPDVSVLCSV